MKILRASPRKVLIQVSEHPEVGYITLLRGENPKFLVTYLDGSADFADYEEIDLIDEAKNLIHENGILEYFTNKSKEEFDFAEFYYNDSRKKWSFLIGKNDFRQKFYVKTDNPVSIAEKIVGAREWCCEKTIYSGVVHTMKEE